MQHSLEKTPWMKPMNGITAGRPLRIGRGQVEGVSRVQEFG